MLYDFEFTGGKMRKRYFRIITLVMSFLMMLALAACGTSDQPVDEQGGEQQQEETSEETDTASSDTLVIYFSATGNTKGVAEKIAEITGADIHEIVPAVPYSDEDIDYGDSARASVEQNDPDARPEIGGEDIDLTNYSTIYIGYPIWYGEAPRILDTFAESHDFSGKTVIPFCTSDSSDIGGSGTDLGEMAGSGDWQTGKRFAGGASGEEIKDWIDELGL